MKRPKFIIFIIIIIIFISYLGYIMRNISLIIDSNTAKEVANKIDTMNCSSEFLNIDIGSKELFNSDLRISYNNSKFHDAFSSGGISISKEGVIKISYRLAESSGPSFEIIIDKYGKIKKGSFQIVGDDSQGSNEVNINIKEIKFNRFPQIGKSLCFHVDFISKYWHFPNGEKQKSHLNIYGFVNEIIVNRNN